MSKWPEVLNLVRHDISTYNALKERRKMSESYQAFIPHYEKYRKLVLDACVPVEAPPELIEMASKLTREFRLSHSDAQTPVTEELSERAVLTGKALAQNNELPDVISVSPHLRTEQTLAGLMEGWPELKNVKLVKDRRIIEKEHGLQTVFNDKRLFHVFNPQQILLESLHGGYHYRLPSGENIDDVRGRIYQWVGMLIRDYADKQVLAVTHHLTILSVLAELERWSESDFLTMNEHSRPLNCSVTRLVCKPTEGKDGHFKRDFYNKTYY